MLKIAENIKEFTKMAPFWNVSVDTDVVFSDDGVGTLLSMLKEREKNAFFVLDAALKPQPRFSALFEQNDIFEFDASFSEPRTQDVDALRSELLKRRKIPDTIVGVGGGAAMDLAKATAICLANPKPAQCYQGFDLDINKGADIWTMPALTGTGAEITPIAVLRGPEKKLGINNHHVQPEVAVIDPQLSADAPHFNRFFTMMDCFFHHCEITASKTSCAEAKADSKEGLEIARSVLSQDLTHYSTPVAVRSSAASLLGGSSSIAGRVGAAHAISYGLSNSAPHLPHSVAVAISICALEDIYPEGRAETLRFLDANGFSVPKASEYGITAGEIERMTSTALGMDKLWLSCFGEEWRSKATKNYIENIYRRIVRE